MTLPYFRQIPNLDYIDRTKESSSLSQFTQVKNLFKRGKIRDDIFGNLVYFEKYEIIGDERPDNVAYKYYGDSTLDWVVLLSNNILNIQSEWPLPQNIFDNVMLEKYGSYEALYSVGEVNGVFYPPHHCETVEIKNSNGMVVLPKGIQVPYTEDIFASEDGLSVITRAVPDFNFTYFDPILQQEIIVPNIDVATIITNYDYEIGIEDAKRSIFLLKREYLSLLISDLEDVMPYKKGAAQYVSSTLKRVDNIKLYE
jgi:hypothetical protein